MSIFPSPFTCITNLKSNHTTGKLALSAVLFAFASSASAQVSFGNASLFNEGWLFNLNDENGADQVSYADSTWRQLNIPHDWSIEGTYSPDLASGTGYLPGGIGWYRKHFSFDKTKSADKRHYLYFEGVYNRSDVYINGYHLGNRPSGYASFMYDITPYLKDGDNVVAVRADHSRYADSRYYTGSGIYRNVWFVEAPETHIAQWGIGFETVNVKGNKASVKVDVAVENPVKGLVVKTALLNADGTVIAEAKRKAESHNVLTMTVSNPKLWSVDTPNLYTLRTELIENGKKIDSSDTKVGIRTLEFNPDTGFALNGKNMKVKGVCIHHDAGALGAVVPEDVWERRLRNLKGLGVNALRMSHNPQAPVVYDIADQLGLLIMDEASDEWEFPKRKWIKGWNKGEPGFDGTYDFFEEWIDRDVADMVRRDRNHPSVFLWSIGNEVDYPNDPYSHPVLNGNNSAISQPMYGGYNPDAPDAMRIGEIAKRLAKVVKSIDTSRPTTGALAGVVMSNETAYPEAVDVVGYNYTEDRYDIDHKTYPERVIYGSENRSDYEAWKAVRDKDFIFGQFIWTGIDYLGESDAWPSRGLYTGLLDFTGNPKPRGKFRESIWSEKPMTYIGTYPKPRRGNWLSIDAWDNWNYSDGDTIRVVCYTNAPQARLTLDNKVIGELKPMDDTTGIIHWDIPFAPGKLTAVGIDNSGNPVSSYSITTSGRPYAITAKTDKESFFKPGEVAHIEIEVVDDNGIPVKLADNDIHVMVRGGGELLALEGADNSDMGNYRDNRQRVYRGRLLAYVRATNPDEPVSITITSPLLQPTSVNITPPDSK
ncbi:MAG: glycoside hydrolase family 2 protein [Bacteroides sp.]|nr:glycoside hydrolase family 2 protein [Bacteroides sp.]